VCSEGLFSTCACTESKQSWTMLTSLAASGRALALPLLDESSQISRPDNCVREIGFQPALALVRDESVGMYEDAT
jgi:hypothetical protein